MPTNSESAGSAYEEWMRCFKIDETALKDLGLRKRQLMVTPSKPMEIERLLGPADNVGPTYQDMMQAARMFSNDWIWLPDIEKMTRQLEYNGYRVWFTCEVDGVEYRLAARK